MTRVTAVPDPNIPDLDLSAEARAMAEVVAALQHAREHFALIRGVFNQQAAALHSIRAEKAMTEAVTAGLWEQRQASRLVEAYRVEALGAAMKSALGISPAPHVAKMAQIVALERRKAEDRGRQAERAKEAAAYAARTTNGTNAAKARAKVTDRSLIEEVRRGRHKSLSDLARKVGLSVSSVSVRCRSLVTRGALDPAEVPRHADHGETHDAN